MESEDLQDKMDKSRSFCFFRTPVGLQDLVSFEGIPAYIGASACFVLSFIRFFSLYTKKDTDGFVNISNKTIYKLCGTSFSNHVFAFLEKNGLIEICHTYKVGEYSKSYRLTPKVAGLKWEKRDYLPFVKSLPCKGIRLVTTDHWKRFTDTFVSWESLPETNPLRGLGEYVAGMMKHLSIEDENNEIPELIAVCAAENQKENERKVKGQNRYVDRVNKKREKDGLPLMPRKKVWTSLESLTESYLNSLDALTDPEQQYVKFHTKSQFGEGPNRLFNNITNLKREFRQFLRYDGQKLVSIDISCAQVCLLSLFYKDSAEHLAEKARFVDFVTNYDFYEELASRAAAELTRKESKLQTFLLMFAKNSTCERKAFYPVFKEMFPLLSTEISRVKEVDYKRVAYEMQCGEARIMITGALDELRARGLVGFSIHDSILTLPESVEAVKETILRHFKRVAGFEPKLKVE